MYLIAHKPVDHAAARFLQPLVKNLGLVGVAGYVDGGEVENCSVTGKVDGDGQVGGVAGRVTVGSVYSIGGVAGGVPTGGGVTNCYSTGKVGGYAQVGGVAGVVYGDSVKNCAARGGVRWQHPYAPEQRGVCRHGYH